MMNILKNQVNIKPNKGIFKVVVVVAILVIFFGCIYVGVNWLKKNPDKNTLHEYDDVRTYTYGGKEYTVKDISAMDISNNGNIISTLWFNKSTKWPEKSKMPLDINPDDILERAKDPGLGVRELHSQGITGKGVNVAIIDQPLYDDHPEFKGKIVAYRDFECKSESSMHGPAVMSLLVGETIGTAPGARVYYAATPTWNADAAYQAKALDWIIEENSKLPSEEKIRVVSISGAPSGQGSPFTKNNDKWDKAVERAEKEGILILDCTEDNGIIGPAFFSDMNDIDNVEKCLPGFPGMGFEAQKTNKIMVPTSPRTTAEECVKGNCSYQYTGRGGLSWAIPYCAGVLAMGWQISPELTSDEIVEILFNSAYENNGTKIIYPSQFIKFVREYYNERKD